MAELIYRMIRLLVAVIGDATGSSAARKNVWREWVDEEWEMWKAKQPETGGERDG